MFFDSPEYTKNYSCLNGYFQIQGNVKIANEIENIIKEQCFNVFSLYETQDYIRDYCINAYGEEFYNKNVEAIMFIIENEYCNLERQQNPYFDKEQYDKDMESGCLY